MKKHYTDAQKQQIMKEVTETGKLTLVAEKPGSWCILFGPLNYPEKK